MNFDQFQHIFNTLYSQKSIIDKYISSLPSELKGYHTDNPQVNALHTISTELLIALVGKSLKEDLEWFIYDWPQLKKSKHIPYIEVTEDNGCVKQYFIKNKEDYLDYVKNEYFNE